MVGWRVKIHPDVREALGSWKHLGAKVDWVLVQLAVSGGSNLVVYGFTSADVAWRRTPLEGKHFYLWWVPSGVSGMQGPEGEEDAPTIFVRHLTHHDSQAPNFAPDSDYADVDLWTLQPLHEEQHDLTMHPVGDVDVRLVAGSPGSGKTVALTYAGIRWAQQGRESKRPEACNVLYVTYTDGLAELARGYFKSYGVQDKIRTLTLPRLVSELTLPGGKSKPWAGERSLETSFMTWFDRLAPTVTGPWRGYPELLRQEIRGYIVGMGLPFDWEREGIGEVPASPILGLETYKRIRRQSLRGQGDAMSDEILSTAHHLAELAVEQGHFAEQRAAYSAIGAVAGAQDSLPWLNELDAVVVDEIQDLTLVQIGVVAEVSRVASLREDCKLFRLAGAGDESQTVQPSGFDWGITHNLLGFHLKHHPDGRDFRKQRRSPVRLAQLIHDSWTLYDHLPKHIKPKADPMATAESNTEEGLLVRWKLSNGVPWEDVLRELRRHPGVALVDVDGRDVGTMLDESGDQESPATSQLFTPSRIKGLERPVVVISGLDRSLKEITNLTNRYEHEYDILATLVARDKIDNVRVALSRSTHMVVIIERDAAQLTASLEIDDADVVDWEGLRSMLREEDQDLSTFDKAYERLRYAEQAIRAGEYSRARQMNELARELASQTGDRALLKMARDQCAEIEEKLVEDEVRRHLAHAHGYFQDQEFTASYEEWRAARERRHRIKAADLKTAVRDFWKEHEGGLEKVATDYWERAANGREVPPWREAGASYRRMAEIRRIQNRESDARALTCLADRYERIPHRAEGEDEVTGLVAVIERYVNCLESTWSADVDVGKYLQEGFPYWFAVDWLEEAGGRLDKHYELYLPWARAASKVYGWTGQKLSDEHPDFAVGVQWAANDLRSSGESLQAVELLQLAGEELPRDLIWLITLLQLVEAPEYQELRDHWREGERRRLSQALTSATRLLEGESAAADPLASGAMLLEGESAAADPLTSLRGKRRDVMVSPEMLRAWMEMVAEEPEVDLNIDQEGGDE